MLKPSASHLGTVGTAVALLLVINGCSGKPGRVAAPTIPNDAGEQAVAKYDTNGNGAIDGDELVKVPALKVTLKRVDKNGDGKVTAEEINERVAAWRRGGAGIMRVAVKVTRDGNPLSGATVKLVPESFLGSAIKMAQATTRSNGTGFLEISRDPTEAGVQLGYYRIEVSLPGPDGQEQIPARFNVQTEYGAEVTLDDPTADQITLNITGK